jgi:hypothetical protein
MLLFIINLRVFREESKDEDGTYLDPLQFMTNISGYILRVTV